MKLGSSLILLAVTAGLAALALTGARTRPAVVAERGPSVQGDVDAWFV